MMNGCHRCYKSGDSDVGSCGLPDLRLYWKFWRNGFPVFMLLRVTGGLLALCCPPSTFPLVLRQSLLDQAHTRVTPKRGDASHFLSKKIFVTHG